MRVGVLSRSINLSLCHRRLYDQLFTNNCTRWNIIFVKKRHNGSQINGGTRTGTTEVCALVCFVGCRAGRRNWRYSYIIGVSLYVYPLTINNGHNTPCRQNRALFFQDSSEDLLRLFYVIIGF